MMDKTEDFCCHCGVIRGKSAIKCRALGRAWKSHLFVKDEKNETRDQSTKRYLFPYNFVVINRGCLDPVVIDRSSQRI